MAAPAHAARDVDVLRLVRALASWQLPFLLAAGVAAGFGARALLTPHHSTSFHVELEQARCPGGAPRAIAFDSAAPGAMIEGHGRLDPHAPRGLQDYFVTCHWNEAGPIPSADCVLEGPDRSEALRLARGATGELKRTGSPLWTAMAESRFIGRCGIEALEELVAGGRTEPAHGSLARVNSAAADAARASFGTFITISAPSEPVPSPRGSFAPVLGALAGLFAAALLAVRRARNGDFAPAVQPFSPPRLATLAAAGLLLSAGMDRVLVVDIGGFTVRFGQLCALVLLGTMLLTRWRARASLTFPSAAVAATLAFLLAATISGFWSGNPTRTLGYLLWGAFDVTAVLLGLALWIDSEARLKQALKLWIGGMLLGCGMAAVQLISFKVTGRAPLGWMSLEGFPRVNGFSYEPSYFALYLVPGAALLLTRFAVHGATAWRSGVLGGLLVLTIGLSTSRSGWLSVAVVVALIVWRAWVRSGRAGLRRAAMAVGGFALAFVLLLAAWPRLAANVTELAAMAFDKLEESSTKPRLESLQQAVVLFSRHPVLGVGHAGYGAYMLEHPEFPQREGSGANEIVTTNLYLELAAETGLVGLVAALVMLGSLLAPLRRSLADARVAADGEALVAREGLLIAALAIFGVQYQFCQTLWRLDIWVLLSLCFAAGLVARRASAAQAPATPELFTDSNRPSAGGEGTRESA